MNNDEIKRGLRDIKSFIISEMKNEDSNWRRHEGRDELEYKSKWLIITIPLKGDRDIGIWLSGSNSYYSSSYTLKDVGLSKMRFNWILKHNIDFFIKNREKREKMENMVSNWNSFITKNKSLNRDKKLEKILK